MQRATCTKRGSAHSSITPPQNVENHDFLSETNVKHGTSMSSRCTLFLIIVVLVGLSIITFPMIVSLLMKKGHPMISRKELNEIIPLEYEPEWNMEIAREELKNSILRGREGKTSSIWAAKTLRNNFRVVKTLMGESFNHNLTSNNNSVKQVQTSIYQSCLEDSVYMEEKTLATKKLTGVDLSNEMIANKYFVVWNTFGLKYPNGPIYSAGTSLINRSNQPLRIIGLKWSLNYNDLTKDEHVEGDVCLVRKSKDESEVSSGSEVFCVHEMVRESSKELHSKRKDEITWLDSGIEVLPSYIVRLNSVTECKGHPPAVHKPDWTRIDGQIIFLTEQGMNYCMQKYKVENQNISEQEVKKKLAPLVSVRSPIHDRSFVVTPFPAYGSYSTFVNTNKEEVR